MEHLRYHTHMATHIHQADSAAAPSQEKKGTEGRSQSVFCTLQSTFKWALVLLPFGYLWFRLINNLRLEWTTNPQYGYGWVVPFLCAGLLFRRWQAFPQNRKQKVEDERGKAESRKQKSTVLLFALLAFLYLPTRLIEAAVPEWRPIQWSLGVIAIGLTLCAIYMGKGRGWLRQLAFPICFFFVAIPWPTLIETPIIQGLTRASAAIVIELLGWVGVPALAHGNVIEVATGMVGIDEACSGIRSFQSSLMISLFFGEFYRLSAGRRWLLIPMGFVFSMAFNICRMSLLTLVAAKKGVAAISQYHDPAGITITILCTLGLWGLAILLRRKKPEVRSQESVVSGQESGVRSRKSAVSSQWSVVSSSFPAVSRLALALLVWLFIVELGVQAWYRSREAHLKPGPTWSLNFPQDNSTLKDIPMDATTRNLLRFDEGKQAAWSESDGTQWEAFYFSWLPGRVAGYLAKRHTPEICLPASGWKLVSGPELTMMNVHGVELPVRSYVFETAAGPINVFHCRWEAGVDERAYVQHESARFNLIRAIWAGRGNQGQKVLEFVILGMDDPEQAKQALARQLEKLIKVEKPEAAP
jgi:exosortase